MYETEKELKVKTYINNYLEELKRHFDMSDKKMRYIIYKIYKERSPIYKIKFFIKKYMSMIKSLYKTKD